MLIGPKDVEWAVASR